MESDSGLSFTRSHFALIASSIVLLTVALFMRGGFTLGAFGFGHAEAEKSVTAEDAMAYAQQQMDADRASLTNAQDPQAAAQDQAQLAALDPSLDTGSVLGASTGLDSSVDVDAVLNSDTVNQVPLILTKTDDFADFNRYAHDIHSVEARYGANILIGALAGRDPATLQAAAQTYKDLIAALRQVKVPTQFEQYHRMKLVYYSSLAQMAVSMSPDGPQEGSGDAASLFFSLNTRLSDLKAQLEAQYGVTL